ncbi:MAG TPA: ABC transporter ATP-binding protein [archaeon]|nr:ABC transporter ATP-binding protein [archaeon]
MSHLIELKSVEKTYEMDEVGLQVLKDINMNVDKGECIAIMGPSGSGKSTMLHMIGCLDRPTKGEVIIDGKDVSRLSDSELAKIRREKIGFVFQSFHLIPSMSALDNVLLPMSFKKTFVGNEEKKRAEKLLDLVGLKKRKDHRPAQLSGGERQRVAIARALANEPEILLADEPTGNLDSQSGKEIIDLLVNLNKEGTTLVLITHDQNIAKYAEKIVRIKDGKIEKIERSGS